MDNNQLPIDFPRDGPFCSLSGSQPKFSAIKIGDRFVAGWTKEELRERHRFCECVVHLLLDYAKCKSKECPDWTRDSLVKRIAKEFAQISNSERWRITPEERDWVMRRVWEQLVEE